MAGLPEGARADVPNVNAPQGRPNTVVRQLFERVRLDREPFNLEPSLQHRLDLVPRVRHRPDNHAPVEQVDRDPVRRDDPFAAVRARFVLGPADRAQAAVGGKDDVGRDGRFESAVQVSEGFDVEHVDLQTGLVQ